MCAPSSGEPASEFYSSIGYDNECTKCGRYLPKHVKACPFCGSTEISGRNN